MIQKLTVTGQNSNLNGSLKQEKLVTRFLRKFKSEPTKMPEQSIADPPTRWTPRRQLQIFLILYLTFHFRIILMIHLFRLDIHLWFHLEFVNGLYFAVLVAFGWPILVILVCLTGYSSDSHGDASLTLHISRVLACERMHSEHFQQTKMQMCANRTAQNHCCLA